MPCYKVSRGSIAFELYDTTGFVEGKAIDLIGKVSTSHVYIINTFLEYRIPGITTVDFSHFEDDLEYNDFESIVETAVISDKFSPIKLNKKRKLHNLVKSAMGTKKRDTLKCNLITFEKRNFNADLSSNVGSSDHVSDVLTDAIFSSFANGSRVAELSEDPIGQNIVALSEWLDKRDGGKTKSLLSRLKTFVYDMADMVRYKLMVKADCKPKLDETPLSQYVTGQNIVFQDKAITAMFSHCFTQCAQRLKYAFEGKCLFFNGTTNEEFAEVVKMRLGDINKYHMYELDISKYDKSQASLMKDVEYKVLNRLGFHGCVLDAFFCGEYDSVVSTMSRELTLSVGSQRRSGGANTWLGNTVVLLGLMAVLLEGKEVELILLSGDDSLIFTKEEVALDTQVISNSWGFDVKLFEQSVPYFCSKYFVQTEQNLYFVPDPFKLLYKLGAERDYDEGLLHEIFTSFVDMTKPFFREEVVRKLVDMDQRKYGANPYSGHAFDVIHVIASNFNQFKRLFLDFDS